MAAGLFLLIESRTQHPMVSLPMFRSPRVQRRHGTMMLWAFGIFGIYFFTSLYLQEILGFSPTKAGLAFVPMALCIAVFAGLARRSRPGRRASHGGARHGGHGRRPVPVRPAGPARRFATLMPGSCSSARARA